MLNRYNSSNSHKLFTKPTTLIENRSSYTLDHAELNLFETKQANFNFDLQFSDPVVVSMIKGKKIMHLRSDSPLEFYPGETIVMPSDEKMYIDFPEAELNNPTQCLALTINKSFIGETLTHLNEHAPKIDCKEGWNWVDSNFHFLQDQQVNHTINRIITLFSEDHYAKSLFAANATRELVAYLMQTKARNFLLNASKDLINNNRLAFVIDYINKNFTEKITITQLCNKACLSRAQFFRAFQNETGMSPIRFINGKRIQFAKRLMVHEGKSVTEACYQSGFNNLNYFCKVFKALEGFSPSVYLQGTNRINIH